MYYKLPNVAVDLDDMKTIHDGFTLDGTARLKNNTGSGDSNDELNCQKCTLVRIRNPYKIADVLRHLGVVMQCDRVNPNQSVRAHGRPPLSASHAHKT